MNDAQLHALQMNFLQMLLMFSVSIVAILAICSASAPLAQIWGCG